MQRFKFIVEVEVGDAFDATVANSILLGTDFDKDGDIEHAVEVTVQAAIERELVDFGGGVVQMLPLHHYQA